uniref:Uncharacterized protein n=1 Tax=Chromera velia CCMP2878 TaxID=1169474 RepID=A0A0G4GG02_9ALVE|mmetsp:Transcript_16443/g.33459  ORF Transcript_16443/g.33459 Transcript_16443/m.33459 type:complete len:354 (-) Transcript_16443:201-1262(-)|eukprot:Cvel_21720.t1-p1 / transcript=Cvel_21720.t1 / gene=Cvel_21720 / organism=Chromera_velia_CCMP2878 / gene_product=hypothetical protein / transcript_product=hypothetical protein / location=Cvel_scaffold2061:13745-14803(+) / protein_length=353 / sequence_SO=supercontig / SO=protein_coding / is_pseudo=false
MTSPNQPTDANLGQARADSAQQAKHNPQQPLLQPVQRVPSFPLSLLCLCTLSVPLCCLRIPRLLGDSGSLVQVVWVAAFGVNVIAVSIPGRFDSREKGQRQAVIPWRQFFEPSGWAFAIWAVIFLLELVLTICVAVAQSSRFGGGGGLSAVRDALPFWVAGNLFQSLWCGAFRPVFKRFLWLSAALLLLAAVSFLLVHSALTEGYRELCSGEGGDVDAIRRRLFLFRVPIALHSAWLCAASCVNFNAWVSVGSRQSLVPLLASGFGSAYVAALAGAAMGGMMEDPLFTLTVAWALAAVGDKNQKGPRFAHSELHQAVALTASTLAALLVVLAVGLVIQQQIWPWACSATSGGS